MWSASAVSRYVQPHACTSHTAWNCAGDNARERAHEAGFDIGNRVGGRPRKEALLAGARLRLRHAEQVSRRVLQSHDPIPMLPRVGECLGERVADGVAGQVTGERASKPGFGADHELLELAVVRHALYVSCITRDAGVRAAHFSRNQG